MNAQKMTDEQRASLHIDMLPQSLPEAVNELSRIHLSKMCLEENYQQR